jgi:hypothetical protein
MYSSEQIQAVFHPATMRAGRPIQSVAAIEWPRPRRVRFGKEVPPLTRKVPTVEIMAGAALGFAIGLVWGISRMGVVDLGWSVIFGTLFGLLIGWLIATFTGATGTLSLRTVLTNMVHIVLVLTIAVFFLVAVGVLAAIAGDAYGPARRDG